MKFAFRSWKRPLKLFKLRDTYQIRLIVQSFPDIIFDILDRQYLRMKDVLRIAEEQYERHRPETTLLYMLLERYSPDFSSNLVEQGK